MRGTLRKLDATSISILEMEFRHFVGHKFRQRLCQANNLNRNFSNVLQMYAEFVIYESFVPTDEDGKPSGQIHFPTSEYSVALFLRWDGVMNLIRCWAGRLFNSLAPQSE